jgi:hypothetical protein
MWKLILVLVLVIYLLNKISVVLLRAFGRQPGPQPPFPPQNDGYTRSNPRDKTPNRGNIKGGEYVDYEEVK